MELERGMDFRLPEYRREVFLRFFLFHCRWRSHPGGVYYLMPWLRERYGWDQETSLWFAFLNGNTQHPVTSLMLHRMCPWPSDSIALERMLQFYEQEYARLPFDTDRRHWKKSLRPAVDSYLDALKPFGSQAVMWDVSAQVAGFKGIWDRATSLYGFGRLSAFSYAEYLKIMGVDFECDDLFLGDIDGSRSHRSGLQIVAGDDPGEVLAYKGGWASNEIESMEWFAKDLLAEAKDRQTTETSVDYFTMESALCTYKSWHKPNRRYPGVYNDMLYDRLVRYEELWPESRITQNFWAARKECLPVWMRLEDQPTDPGCKPIKQNWYRLYGEVPVMGHDDPVFWSSFDIGVQEGWWGERD